MKRNLYFESQAPTATLPSPKLARIMLMYQRTTLSMDEVSAPPL